MHWIVDINALPHTKRDRIWRDAVCDAFVHLDCPANGPRPCTAVLSLASSMNCTSHVSSVQPNLLSVSVRAPPKLPKLTF